MKKFTFMCAIMLMTMSLFAQQFTLKELGPIPSNLRPSGAKVIDTLRGPVFSTTQLCADSLTYYDIGAGYLTGNGSISSNVLKECSQAYDNTLSATVTGAIAIIGKITGTTGSLTAKVYSVDAAFKPATVLATSNAVSTSTMVAPPNVNVCPFTFTTPPAVTGNFAVSVVFPTTAGDTALVCQTRAGCFSTGKDGYAYANATPVGWLQYKTIMAAQSMGSFDLYIFAIINTGSDIAENPLNALLSVYPNPTNDIVNIVSLSTIRKITVVNSLGQTVSSFDANGYLYTMNTANMNSGLYFLQIDTEKGLITKKLQVK